MASISQQIDQARRRPLPHILGIAGLIVLVAGIIAWVLLADRVTTSLAVSPQKQRIIESVAPPPLLPLALKPIAPQDARTLNAAVPLAALHPAPARAFRFPGSPPDFERAVDCLAAAEWYEAGGDTAWQKAVAQTVINRARHPAFPASICGVVFQGSERRTGCQFSFTCDGAMDRLPSALAWQRARAVAVAALSGEVYAPVGFATHYHADYVVPYWADSLDKIAVIGPHIFYRWPGHWGTAPAFRQAVSGTEPVEPSLVRLSHAHAALPAEIAPAPGETAGPALAANPAPRGGAAVAGVTAAALRGSLVRDASDDGSVIFLKLDPQAFPGTYAITSLALCKGKRTCRVLGWREDAAAAHALPLSADSASALSFLYIKDMKRGIESARWNCAQFSRANQDQCLTSDTAALQRLVSPD